MGGCTVIKSMKGIHHISAIVGHPQATADFYAGVLGLRLLKKTVNFDDPNTYHLYFGNELGDPGTIMTFFNWMDGPKGRIGNGQVGVIAFAIPENSLPFWENRLTQFAIPFNDTSRFGERSITFEDSHGVKLELVERPEGNTNGWSFNGVTKEVAIQGFAGVTLFSQNVNATETLLEQQFQMKRTGEQKGFFRYQAAGNIGNVIDITAVQSGRGEIGIGTVHHIAWRAEEDDDQLEWKQQLEAQGYHVTPVHDRSYFKAVYFREVGGILFEIATDPPGFTTDEEAAMLGQQLQLPARYEINRSKLESTLPPFTIREIGEING